ncbi:MAG TPA: hypothetical protein VE338_04080 [Ktedonobacterales bacterium]|jgi:hypothetical protein|nr:hypothetical protein [Ktedonobacterales bacterium]
MQTAKVKLSLVSAVVSTRLAIPILSISSQYTPALVRRDGQA